MTEHTDIHRIVPVPDLLDAIEGTVTGAPADSISVTSVTADSRAVVPGSLFVAVRGVAADGHRYIPDAIAAGASMIVAEELPRHVTETLPPQVVAVTVADSRDALGHLASRFYGDPSEELTLVGVTGTNGKTTIATLLYELATMAGKKAGLLSTVANIIAGTSEAATHTTPDPVALNALLRRMVDAGCTFAAMEVSSHAADQHRIAGLTFAGGIFTNLTRDHLDYHRTFDAYLRAKQSFFDMLPPTAFALTNADDRNGAIMVQNTAAMRRTYSIRGVADYTGRVEEDRLDGMLIAFDGTPVETLFSGRFNASNLTAVYGAAMLLGYKREDLLTYISRLTPVAGRFQPIRSRSGITAIVDYAHTPDALVNVLDTIGEVAPVDARIITVCGAGGERDHGKRPLMARAAADRSDILILTSDNPRSEDPDTIIADMLAGLDTAAREHTATITDRRLAIAHAVEMARPADVILIAGKGHEDYQIIGNTKHHFDDREEVRRAFEILDK